MSVLRIFVSVVIGLSLASHASGAVLYEWREVDNNSALEGYVTQDLIVTTDVGWTSAQMLIELDTGSIFYHEEGDRTPPHSGLFGDFPSLAYDTYLTAGENDFGSSPSISGGAVDLGGGSTEQFESQLLDVNWFTADAPTGELFLGRFTLSAEATGEWSMRLGFGAEDPLIIREMPVSSGVLVPEPGSGVLLCALAAALAARRRPLRQAQDV